jgi:IS30 family transposase
MKNHYHRLTLAEREEISKGLWAGENFSRIAARIEKDPSCVSREVWSNVKRKRRSYHATEAQIRAKEYSQKRGRKKKLNQVKKLLDYVQEKLRQDWSPEEIAKRLKLDYADDMTMRISHEAIYQYLYCLPRGELKKELMKGLRQNRQRRLSRTAIHYRRQRIPDLVSISERPEETKDRTVPGHWEGDLIIGKNIQSAIGTLVERTTRLTLLVPLKEKNALAVRNAFVKAFKKIPRKFKKSLTYDRGSEMSEHRLFSQETKIKVYFADPHAPWQRGTNENTNGLIRQYFPKGTDFHTVSLATIREVERRLNSRPRKVLGFYTPSECFYKLITDSKNALES